MKSTKLTLHLELLNKQQIDLLHHHLKILNMKQVGLEFVLHIQNSTNLIPFYEKKQ
jgi:hypothetical protein